MKTKLNIFYTTCGSKSTSQDLAKSLLLDKKVVCVNVIKNVESYYKENKKIKSANEIIIIIKTFMSKIKIEKIIKNIHPYDVPFLIQINTNEVNKEYLEWAKKNE